MISPRRTRLVRVPELHAFRRVIRVLAASAGRETQPVIVPNRAAARLLGGGVTRDEFYTLLQQRLPGAPRLLSGFEREAIAQSAAADAAGAVPQLSFQIRPGLVAEMLRFYDQLRRQSQTVKRFAELIGQALGGDTAADRGAERMLRQTRFLERTFDGYERRVAASGACDEHQLRARLVAARVDPPVRRATVTVADWIADRDGLFVADFDLLSRMPGVEAIDVVCTEAVLESGFHQRLHDWLPGIEETDAAAIAGEASVVRPFLLTPPGAPPEQPWFTYRDREEELIAVARACARWADRPPADGRRPDLQVRHAVVYKRPLPYLYLAPSTLGAAGIPYHTADTLPLAAEPAAAAVDLVLDAVETSFSRDSLLALLRSPHFRFADEALSRDALSAFDRLLCEQRYLGEVTRLEDLAAGWSDPVSLPAFGIARSVASALASLAGPAPASAAIRRLREFLTTHARPLDPTDPFALRERRARAAIDDILGDLAGAHAGHHDPDWAIADLSAAVRRWVQEKTFTVDSAGAGVHLVDDQAARYGEFERIAIVGLIEDEWPERPRRNIFYPPGLLKALGWPSERDRRAAADARFLDLLASASAAVTLSTFTLDDEAIVTRSTQLDEIPRARLSSVQEDLPAWAPLFPDDGLTATPPSFDRLDSYAREWADLRLGRPPADAAEFHGRSGPPPAKAWSVSALETYVECPFKFFARHVLALDEEPEDEEVMDPRRQGQFVHAVFEEFFRAWQNAERGAITPADLDEARHLFVQVVDRELERQHLSEAEAGLERTRLLGSPAAAGLGDAVFRMEAERPLPVVERLLEFKLQGDLQLDTSAGPRRVALRGKADRIDLLEDGTFRLIDYKLGWPPERSRALQLPVYALFAEQRLAGYRGRRWTLGEAAYLAFKGPRRVVPLFTSAAPRAEVMRRAQDRLAETLNGVARGEYPPRPDDVYRCETCSFAAVCRKDYVAP